MVIAIISDTHIPTKAPELPQACRRRLIAADAIIHAGDFSQIEALRDLRALGPPVIAVHGNVDSEAVRVELPSTAELQVGDTRIAVIHDAGPERGRLGRRFPTADGVIFGHTHIPLHVDGEGVPWILNPGSPTDRRRQPHHTMAEIHVDADVLDVEFLALDGGSTSPLPDALVRGRAGSGE